MKLPRDISARELANLLTRYGYLVTRQTGSHLRLTTQIGGEHHLTIPAHSSLRVGTLSVILNEVAQHLKQDKSDLIRELLG
ncbi:MAG: type II toxin-antitoxin system HicA family toxin [Candidatus Omnitrophica bacterium]|nr:type II toxin-antitoxin system HicA family toxin [Candidatus Omnitrophota bacterium]MBU0896735.1 type II toxin-antitoxin system HicA family toxin [Candidatus Omnitrophota bacterium]MBU1134379.1 type II toxin-antitoxin system HicA family toxin [Candidatus Omnitrophota bacterium]MBU1809998.1 type II toxin-antitoxin system HicA family toxin [Candidatus Omnitrophota bacterium]